MVVVNFSRVKLLVGEKYWSPLKNWSLFTVCFFIDKVGHYNCGIMAKKVYFIFFYFMLWKQKKDRIVTTDSSAKISQQTQNKYIRDTWRTQNLSADHLSRTQTFHEIDELRISWYTQAGRNPWHANGRKKLIA